VGLGALFFAPNRRFIMAAAWCVFWVEYRVCGRVRCGLYSRWMLLDCSSTGMLVGFVRER
jgi:hypothetical protein